MRALKDNFKTTLWWTRAWWVHCFIIFRGLKIKCPPFCPLLFQRRNSELFLTIFICRCVHLDFLLLIWWGNDLCEATNIWQLIYLFSRNQTGIRHPIYLSLFPFPPILASVAPVPGHQWMSSSSPATFAGAHSLPSAPTTSWKETLNHG